MCLLEHSELNETPSMIPMISSIVDLQSFTILVNCCIFSGEGYVTHAIEWGCNHWTMSLSILQRMQEQADGVIPKSKQRFLKLMVLPK
jgi:hypothetical protein